MFETIRDCQRPIKVLIPRLLSPLCLPISPRGNELFSPVFMLIYIIEQDE